MSNLLWRLVWLNLFVRVVQGNWDTGQWYDAPQTMNADEQEWEAPSPICNRTMSSDGEEGYCPDGWIRGAAGDEFAGCIKRLPPVKVRDDAQKACVAEGANLVSIHSRYENNIVRETCGIRMCWIGLVRDSAAGAPKDGWKWIDGSEVSFEYWAEGQPDNFGDGEMSVIMHLDPAIGAALFWGFMFFVTFWSIIISCVFGNCALGIAHVQRKPMLERAKSGELVRPPGCPWRYCCGASAIYYWDGCTGMVWMSCFCGHCCGSALCCWAPGPMPKENGIPVGGAVMVTAQAVGQHVGPAPTVVGTGGAVMGQPVMGTPVMGHPVQGSAHPGDPPTKGGQQPGQAMPVGTAVAVPVATTATVVAATAVPVQATPVQATAVAQPADEDNPDMTGQARPAAR